MPARLARRRSRAVLLAILALPAFGLAALPGCLEPYRVRVDPDVLSASPLEWNVTVGRLTKEGWFGPRAQDTRYSHDPDDTPPYPGVFRVLSVRETDRTPTSRLLELTQEFIEEDVVEHDIELSDTDVRGERRLQNGVTTQWFVREGRTESRGALFDRSSTIRILGEVGYDGKSSTSFVVVALAQVSELDTTPLIGGERTDLRTWVAIAGDPRGSVHGAQSQNGLVYHLKTHG